MSPYKTVPHNTAIWDKFIRITTAESTRGLNTHLLPRRRVSRGRTTPESYTKRRVSQIAVSFRPASPSSNDRRQKSLRWSHQSLWRFAINTGSRFVRKKFARGATLSAEWAFVPFAYCTRFFFGGALSKLSCLRFKSRLESWFFYDDESVLLCGCRFFLFIGVLFGMCFFVFFGREN